MFKSQGRLVDEKFLDELFAALIKTDMGVPATKEIVAEIGTKYRARVVHMTEIVDDIKGQLKTLMAQPERADQASPRPARRSSWSAA
ncbi:MAG: signal recognition particle receptor subunit alpha [Pirellulales bacterium]